MSGIFYQVIDAPDNGAIGQLLAVGPSSTVVLEYRIRRDMVTCAFGTEQIREIPLAMG
jgi:hypothetical protein